MGRRVKLRRQCRRGISWARGILISDMGEATVAGAETADITEIIEVPVQRAEQAPQAGRRPPAAGVAPCSAG